ncbi:flavin reductase family protein [Streptomyces sp. NBC_00683]|uniref:flavin reductase family protein n=1 Tax=unclassified Streptomyces TaxID=2593676 RepID=UPI002E35BE23|nr:flavin reductase family protein [Streptomyces sp. NBC_00683]
MPTQQIRSVSDDLRSVMRLFPTGVALLRTGEGERATAMTINALMSVSLTPPQLLVSVLHSSRAHAVLEDHRAFSVHLLGDQQAETARLFASASKPQGRDLAAFIDRYVVPGSLARLTCSLRSVYPGGDHSLFLGHVDAVEAAVSAEGPLLFHGGALRGFE